MTTLGKYELHEVIGKGGFGTVYRATDACLGWVVAINVFNIFASDGREHGV